MPEVRVTITQKMDRCISEIIDQTGLFASKAEFVRFATVTYLKEFGWTKPAATQTERRSDD